MVEQIGAVQPLKQYSRNNDQRDTLFPPQASAFGNREGIIIAASLPFTGGKSALY